MIEPTLNQAKEHFRWIDFLRGLSALGVVLFHVRVDLWVGWEAIHNAPDGFSRWDRLAALLSIPTSFLGSAVMLFFLVSGFCVHFPYAAGRKLEIKPYAIRRWLRIYPPYLLAVLLGFVIEEFLKVRYGTLPSVLSLTERSALMLQNYGGQPGQMASNPSLWSLPVEAELYLAYPFVYWFAARQGWKYAFAIVTGVSLTAFALSFRFPNVIIVHFAVYWMIWCAGALLAQAVARGKLPAWNGWLTLLMALTLLVAMAAHLKKFPSLTQNFTAALFYFMLMLWGLAHPEPLRRLNKRFIKSVAFVGTISYSLYLIHFPLFKLCGALWVERFGAKPANFFIPLAFSLLIIPVAALFHYVIEAPSHRIARRTGRQKALSRVSAAPLLPAEEGAASVETGPILRNDSAPS